MTATATDRNTPRRAGQQYNDPVAAGVKINAGALTVLDAAGNVKPGVTGTGLKTRGVAQRPADNSLGTAGAINALSESGVFAFATDGTITRANLESTVYIVDDQTVAATDGTTTRSAAGQLKDLEGSGASAIAWVQVG